MDSPGGGRRWPGTSRRARASGAAHARASDARVGTRAASAQDETRRAILGRAAGAADSGRGAPVSDFLAAPFNPSDGAPARPVSTLAVEPERCRSGTKMRLLAAVPVGGIFNPHSDAMNPEARCRADRPGLGGSESRNRLSELLAWPVPFFVTTENTRRRGTHDPSCGAIPPRPLVRRGGNAVELGPPSGTGIPRRRLHRRPRRDHWLRGRGREAYRGALRRTSRRYPLHLEHHQVTVRHHL